MGAPKRIILCADDFAQDAAISRGILQLGELGRLSAVSCFSDAPLWDEYGGELPSGGDGLLVGLHFNLSHPFGRGEKPLPYWMLGAVTGRLHEAALRSHLQRQIDAFFRVRGELPAFIDGHQHVHAFPVIRSVVHALAAEAAAETPIRIRDVRAPVGATDAPFKRRVIRGLANWGSQPENAARLAMNSSFAGDYSLRADADFERLFADWLACSADGGLIMCHPGCADGAGAHAARSRELSFFAAETFAELLARHGCRLAA
jgi:predicted glycoside hydrolase/deacetylase ChbG (UPF0249 family)